MTFEEARRYLIGNFENMNLVEVVSVLSSVREEYAPAIEMTKTDKDVLLCYLENYSFYAFIETIHRSKSNTFGLPANKEFENLSDEDLMQAWLHPESIKVVDK